MTSASMDANGMWVPKPDIKIKLTYISFTIPGANPANLQVNQGLGVSDITVTPVITGMYITPGQVRVVNKTDASGKALYSLGMTTVPDGKMSPSGAVTNASLFTRSVPGAPTLVQVAGYDKTNAIANGDGAKINSAVTFKNKMGAVETGNGVFVEDNSYPVVIDSKVMPATQMLDSGASRVGGRAGNADEPKKPDYLFQIPTVGFTTCRVN